jgi:tetratricopeptide (TPR) repeat protein
VARARALLFVCLASCAVRAPAPVDVAALIAQAGPVEARRTLEIRIAAAPRDVAARLALAALDEQLHRSSEAIDALEAVLAIGGPLGPRWRADDQARLARLIAARGRARLAREAKTALADLERARTLAGAHADIQPDELRRAQIARAIGELRHSDAEVREHGRETLAALAAPEPRAVGAPGELAGETAEAWRGAPREAGPAARGRFGAWLWERGARRAAWDELSAWHAATPPPRDAALQDAYLVAARWWTPMDQPGPPVDELVGSIRCAFVLAGCAATDIAGENLLERAYLIAPRTARVTDPGEAAAIAVITLHQALRGEASWGAAITARVEVAAFADPRQLARVPRFAQPIFARLAGRGAAPPAPAAGDGATADQRLVIAAERLLAGATAADIEPLIGSAPYADELRRVAAPPPAFTGAPRIEAAIRHASLTVPGAAHAEALRAIATAYLRDPAVADRLARDLVAGAVDAALADAVIGAVFDALGDPARARAAWQAAVSASDEPSFLAGLAEAQARQGDADAALISATAAAAWSGDPARVWAAVARALADTGKFVHALDAARSAIDLAGPDSLDAALDTAITASAALGRDDQVAALAAYRARFAPGGAPANESDSEDPTDARAALAAYRQHPTSGTIARMWVAARWNPRAVELRAALRAATTRDDPRHTVVVSELVELAGDRDPTLRHAAVAALRE